MPAVTPETINQSTAGWSLPFCHCYDMWLCLQQNNQQVLSEWEALTTLLCRLTMIDSSIVLYPWKCLDHSSQPALHLSSASSRFCHLETYAPQLISFKWLDTPMQQSSLFLGSTIPQSHLPGNSAPGYTLPSRACGLNNCHQLSKLSALGGFSSWLQNTTWTNYDAQSLQPQGFKLHYVIAGYKTICWNGKYARHHQPKQFILKWTARHHTITGNRLAYYSRLKRSSRQV